MARILVSGLINVETTVPVAGFPLVYAPVHYLFGGIRATVSGVGFNIGKALTRLGHEVRLLSLVGQDPAGGLIRQQLVAAGLGSEFVLPQLARTAQSVILYDPAGRRQIHVDLQDVQAQSYPPALFAQALAGCDLAVLCNINFSRPFLTRTGPIPVASDVHTIADLEDAYNREFMAAAHILFMSDEALPCAPEEWVGRVQQRYGTPIMGIGLGPAGALLAVRQVGSVVRIPAVTPRPVVNTIGAGDALFSAFLHGYVSHGDPLRAMRQAVAFAGYKIGESGAAEGFLDPAGLAAIS